MGRTRRSTPKRSAAEPVSSGPIRPTSKKPPPQPSGHGCSFGLCCHFGLTCVNPHTDAEVEFFTRRDTLKLQLREMSLEVEKQKVEYKKKKVAASRKPLESLTNSKPSKPTHTSQPTQVDSPQPSKKKGATAAKTATAAAGASTASKSAAKPVAAPASSPAPNVTSQVTVIQTPLVLPVVQWQSIAISHEKCLRSMQQCDNKCILRTAAKNFEFVGNFRVQLAVWGRSLPPSWFQKQPSSYDPAFVLQSGHDFHADFAISYPGKHNLWVRHSASLLWYPIWKQDGTVLVSRLQDQ